MSPARLVLAALACVTLAACATTNVKPPQPPDATILTKAEAMIDKAAAAGAAELAPDALSAARRRLTVARMIVYRKSGPVFGEAERERVQRLVDAAYLDARLALIRTQSDAVARKRQQLATRLSGPTGDTDNTDNTDAARQREAQ